MLAAEKQGITPEALIARVRDEHLADFTGFHIGYDNYYSTNSPENKAFAEQIYKTLRASDKIVSRTIEQLFDPEKQMFLPDRFVKGECPKCGARDQYGDNCEVCGATYSPTELKNPYSAVSGATPVLKTSEHYFFRLGECADFLKDWTAGSSERADGAVQPHLQPESLNKMNEWIEGGLQDWDISRDAPYFASRFRMRRASISMCGWTRRSATWLRSRTCATASVLISTSGSRRIPRPRCITSSARTSCISTHCSGRRC